jgi:hypothetical protein
MDTMLQSRCNGIFGAPHRALLCMGFAPSLLDSGGLCESFTQDFVLGYFPAVPTGLLVCNRLVPHAEARG